MRHAEALAASPRSHQEDQNVQPQTAVQKYHPNLAVGRLSINKWIPNSWSICGNSNSMGFQIIDDIDGISGGLQMRDPQ